MLEGWNENALHSLVEAIDRLYAVFAQYKLAEHVTGPHCTGPADNARLHSKPLKDLTSDDLERFARKVMTTLGSVDDFKHFLPRLMELTAQSGDIGDCDAEIVLGKLTYGDWSLWPKGEQDAIDQFLTAQWRNVLATFPCEPDVNRRLCCIGQATDDLQPYLCEWTSDLRFPALLHLVDLIQQDLEKLTKKHTLANAFWSDRQRQAQQVVDWLLAAETRQYLEDGFFKYSDAEFAGELSVAVDHLGIISSCFSR